MQIVEHLTGVSYNTLRFKKENNDHKSQGHPYPCIDSNHCLDRRSRSTLEVEREND